jgi:hypothetical protein
MLGGPYALVAPVSLCLGLGAGFVMHRADFCLAGAFRDVFLFRSTFTLRMVGLAVLASMVAFESARWLGILPAYPFPLLGEASVLTAVGGLLFGVGMVLAGGCVVGTLYRVGAGSILSLVALAGLVVGSALYAEIHPWWSAVTRAGQLLPAGITLPAMLGAEPIALIAPVALVGAAVLYGLGRQGGWARASPATGYLQPWKAALLLALMGLLSYLLVGMPLGVTTSYAKLGAFAEQWLWPERAAALPYFSAEPLRYSPPFSAEVVSGGPGPRMDAIAAVQFPLIAGIILGGTLSAALASELRVYARVPARQYVSALAGGLVMGLAARMAPACNVWHLLGGLPVLAAQSLLFVLGLVPGAWLGSRLLVRFVLR